MGVSLQHESAKHAMRELDQTASRLAQSQIECAHLYAALKAIEEYAMEVEDGRMFVPQAILQQANRALRKHEGRSL